MKRVALVSLIIVSFLTGFALKTLLTEKNTGIPEMKKANRQLDEELIRKREAAYDQAWHVGNIEGIVACFTKDATIISPRDDVAHGLREIRDLFAELLNGPARGSQHTSRIIRISFVTDDVAVLDGEAIVGGAEFGEMSSLAHHRFTDILVRVGDDWLISQIRAYANY